jgi:PPK2 family polyphosphate:nucleotide phosphotransferase
MNSDKFLVPPGHSVKLKHYSPANTKPYASKEEAADKLQRDILKLADWQAKLFAQNTYSLLIVLQGIDAAGKDGTIKHVMSGVNPSGCRVTSFKTPSNNELEHDYLWRHVCALPQCGQIGIFNRSYYEEVVVVRVHPEMLKLERIPGDTKPDKLWSQRFRDINHFERYLVDNGVEVLKFFLHLSKEEQKRRFLARLDLPDKNWKFSLADVKEREFWDDYQTAFEEMLSHTSTSHAPWYIIPADNKWFTHTAVADIVVQKLASLGVDYPQMTSEQKKALESAKQTLLKEE